MYVSNTYKWKRTKTNKQHCLSIPFQVLDEYSEQIHDLTRKFFHHLLRHNQLAKSFQLAVDINDYDLFMDLYHSASRMGLTDLAEASSIKVGKNIR